VLLSSISFVVGAGLAGFFLHRPAASPGHDLAAPTRSVLEHLRAPVTVHYYSLLPGDSDPALSAFAARVAALLDQLARMGNWLRHHGRGDLALCDRSVLEPAFGRLACEAPLVAELTDDFLKEIHLP